MVSRWSWIGIFKKALIGAAEIILFSAVAGHWLAVSPAAASPVYNRYFDNLLMILDRQIPESCNMRGICTNQWVIEADGSTYPCD